MTGLPDATLSDIDDALDFISTLPLTHVSCYALTCPTAPSLRKCLHAMHVFRMMPAKGRCFIALRDVLIGRGFQHYEISNFALDSFQSRHNLVYWRAGPCWLRDLPPAVIWLVSGVTILLLWLSGKNLSPPKGLIQKQIFAGIVSEEEAAKETMPRLTLTRGCEGQGFPGRALARIIAFCLHQR